MALEHVSLDDKFDLTKSRIFSTGYQALVRLTLMQKELDRRAGLNTAGFVTGYRGSPLGGLDQQFMRPSLLDQYDVKFQPGLNEDLAATAIWARSRPKLRGEGKYDGVFGMRSKAPGVDRCGTRRRTCPHRAARPAASPRSRWRRVLVEAGLEFDVVLVEPGLGPHELLVEPAERRAAITGHESRRVEPRAAVELLLHQGEAHQSLIAGRKDPALGQVELVVERDVLKRHRGGLPRASVPS